jgi:hypothetical protein
MSSADAPYCKTSAEAFAPGAVFPNGYRRVGDERSPYQLVLDLQNECFRRFDEMAAALATERAARQRDVAAHAKAIAESAAPKTKPSTASLLSSMPNGAPKTLPSAPSPPHMRPT